MAAGSIVTKDVEANTIAGGNLHKNKGLGSHNFIVKVECDEIMAFFINHYNKNRLEINNFQTINEQ